MNLSYALSIVYFLGGIISVAVMISFLFENVKKINIAFITLLIFLAWWSFGCYFWINSGDLNEANFWVGMANFGFTMIPVTFYGWIVVLLKKPRLLIVSMGYILSLIFALLSFSNLYYVELTPNSLLSFWPKAGPLYLIYVLFIYLGFYILGIWELFRALEKKDNRNYIIKNILFSSIVILFLGISNFPLWYGIKITPYGGVLSIFLTLFLLIYVVVKNKIISTKAFCIQFLIGLILSVNFIEIIFSKSGIEIIYRMIILVFSMFFSALLVKSYKNDILQEQALLKLGGKLENSNMKLKELDNAKNEFISIAAHQLRTPPTVIKGYLNLAKEDPHNKMDPETRDSLSRALASNERLIELVEDILNISRIESGKMSYEFEPNQSCKKIIGELKESFQVKAQSKKLELKIILPEKELPGTTMDYKKIREVVSNLVDNAIKYTRIGEVVIKVFETKNNKIRIAISDTGIGISKDDIGKLFKKFSRGSNVEQLSLEGIGLGIYVGRKIVEAHGGRIWAQSEGLEKGSTFTIELPIK